MNTKGTKFLAVLAVLAVAFSAFAVIDTAETDDAATAVTTSGLTLEFGGDAVKVETYDFSVSANQDLTAEISGGAVNLKGQLFEVQGGVNETVLEGAPFYFGDGIHFGIYFKVTGLPEGSKATITGTFDGPVINSGEDDVYAMFSSPRTAASVKEFTYSVDTNGDGTADKNVKINMEKLLIYQEGTNYYFSYADAVAAGDSVTLVQNTTVGSMTIALGKTLVVPTGKTLTVKSGCVLTVAGTLNNEGGTVIVEKGAAIVKTGTISTPDNVRNEGGSTKVVITQPDGTEDQQIDDVVTAGEAASKDSIVSITTNDVVNGVAVTVKKNNLTLVNNGVTDDKITGIDMTVEATGSDSKSISFAGFTGGVSGTIKTTDGTKTQTMTLSNVKGNFTVSKGSLIIDGEITEGDIQLADKAEVRISGDVAGVSFTVPASKSAKIIIDQGATLDVQGTVNIGAGIALEVNGTIKSTVGIPVIALDEGTSVTFNSGAKVLDATTKVKITSGNLDASANTIYSGADVNALHTESSISKFTGKDAASGTWTLAGTVLTLDNYNGSYNFGPVAATLTKIILIGDNTISYAVSADYAGMTLFGNALTDIETDIGAGSLTINADLSAATGAALANSFVAIQGTDLKLDEISLAINVTGTNNAWTATQKEVMDVLGLKATASFTMYNSIFIADVMSAYGYGVNFDLTGSEIKSSLFTTFDGLSYFKTSVAVKNSSIVNIGGNVEITALEINQESDLTVKDVVFKGASVNKANFTVNGDMLITNGASLTNNANMNVAGNVTALGTFVTNSDMVNTGSISVNGRVVEVAAGKSITITNTPETKEAMTTTTAMVKSISFSVVGGNIDDYGVASGIAALVSFDKKDSTVVDIAYTGKLTPVAYGTGYTLELENVTSKITVTYDGGATMKVGKAFAISVSGKVGDDSIIANKAESDVAHVVDGLFGASTGSFNVAAGTFTNMGTVTISKITGAIVAVDAVYNGPVTANVAIAVAGELNGDITSKDAVTINATGVMDGDITAKGVVDIDGELNGNVDTQGNVNVDKKMTGDITTKGNVIITGGEYDGHIVVNANGKFVQSVGGTVTATVTYNYEYTATKGSDVKTTGTATATLEGKADYQLNLVAPVDSNETTDGVAGFLALEGAPANMGKDGIVFTINAGKFGVPASIAMPAKTSIVIEAGAIVEVTKGQSLDVTASSLKVSNDATMNIDDGSEIPDYGTVEYVMKFTTSSGYIIFSDVAYALSNCDENSDLEVGSDAVIPATTPVDIKEGVNVIINDGITVDFGANALTMKDGAKITIIGTGAVTFTATGDNGEAGAKKVYYYVSGTFEFDDGANAIVLDSVRFTAPSIITGKAAIDEEPSKLDISLSYETGSATLSAGNATGTVVLAHQHAVVEKTSGAFTVAAGAVCDADITDINKTADDIASKITINGILNVSTAVSFVGQVEGSGQIVLNTTATATFVNAKAVASITVADAEGNGYTLDGITADTNDIIIEIVSGTPNYAKISGQYKAGTITALTGAYIEGFHVMKGATFVADSVKVLTASESQGVLKTKTMDKDTVENLDYDTIYTEGAYTVFTALENIDLTKVSAVTVEKDGYALPEKIEGTATITIKDGVIATVAGKAIIGTAPTTLGGDIAIVGKIAIPDDAYLIVYTGVDMSKAIILSSDEETAPVKSVFDIDGTEYATVYASKDAPTIVTLDFPAADLNPQIVGYTFTSWKAYNDEDLDAALIGTSNVTGAAVAQKVVVKATFLEGVQYYCNGILYDAVGIDNKVTVGSIFTAKIVDYSRYQGTPLVNGQNAFEVTENVTLTVTGVSPVTPEPEPEPQTGMTLTEILLIVLVILIAVMVVVLLIRLNRS